jgi:phytoene/squalene synthetase
MPVGRFVLDVHGEDRSTWPANDALCAALQIINHLQDCKDDYRNLDRVYIPLDTLAAHATGVEALDAQHASPALLAALHELAERTDKLLTESDVFPLLISDRRLGLEVSVINALAHRLTRILMTHDPLSDRVHLSMPAVAGVTVIGIVGGAFRRLNRRASATAHTPRGA